MSGTASPADVQRVVSDVLAPYLGANMATASVKGYIARLGPSVTTISAEQAETLVGWIAPGLKVFVGEARSAVVLADVRRALKALLEAP